MNAIAATVASTVDRTTIRLQLIGDVQGFGIRPLIASLASQHDLVGSVRNCRQGVDIVITGSQTTVDQFREALQVRIPLAKQLVLANCELEPSDRFAILDSIADGVVQFAIPRDRIICEECVQEIQTPSNRRFGYALNGCAQCGPRYSIISAMPYDRKHTSMEGFTMCGDCQTEFDDPVHRRFHAQTNCCSKCGPNVWYEESCDCIEDSATAIKSAAHAILQGRILALKGLGGYQLVCDATNQKAVEKLRLRKQRRTKPFAVMVASVQDASVIAELNNQNAEALRGPAGPIVILQPKPNSGLAPNIHAGFGSVGLMLPTTALHVLLLNATQKNLVVTSGNLEGEPQEYREVEAARNLRSIADCFLHHNRPIINPIDDSVVQSMAGNLVTLRPARGLTPMQINYQTSLQILALGGQQKSAIALSNGSTTILGPHAGDLDSMRSRDRYLFQKATLQNLMSCEATIVACDQHPDYFTSRVAVAANIEEYQTTQHHHAHIVSTMVENEWANRTVLGFAFDGTGMGSDGTIWGGEILIADQFSFHRVGHLRTFPLVGRDASVKFPWRVAVALLMDALGEQQTVRLVEQRFLSKWQISQTEVDNVMRLSKQARNAPRASSMGRLFDGIASMVCGIGQANFESEPAMRLEGVCNLQITDSYSIGISDASPFELDWRPLVQELIVDIESGESTGAISMKFHRAIARCIIAVAARFPELPIAFGGGVFQNQKLVELIDELCRVQKFTFAMPCKIPPNDGGLAVGQLAIVAARAARELCV